MAPAFANSRCTLWTLFAFGILAVVTPQASGAIRHPQHRLAVQQIQQLETEWRAAQLGADIPAMDRLLSDDFWESPLPAPWSQNLSNWNACEHASSPSSR